MFGALQKFALDVGEQWSGIVNEVLCSKAEIVNKTFGLGEHCSEPARMEGMRQGWVKR